MRLFVSALSGDQGHPKMHQVLLKAIANEGLGQAIDKKGAQDAGHEPTRPILNAFSDEKVDKQVL